MLRTPDEKRTPSKVGIDDAAAAAVRPEGGADPSEQFGYLWGFQVLNPNDVESTFRSDSCSPHPLGDLIGMRCRLGEEQVEGSRDHWLPVRIGQRKVIIVGVREDDDLVFVSGSGGPAPPPPQPQLPHFPSPPPLLIS